jgi:UrcA family protein
MYPMIMLSTLALLMAPATETPSVRVAYSDLNLASAAGAATLERRIAHAVETVCPAPVTRQLAEIQAVDACRRAAFRQIAAQLAGAPVDFILAGR